jgi:hypothetical protein
MGFPISDNSPGQKVHVDWLDADGNPADTTGCSVAWAVSNPAVGAVEVDPANPLTDGVFKLTDGPTPLGDVSISAVLTLPDGTTGVATDPNTGVATIVASQAVSGSVSFPPSA